MKKTVYSFLATFLVANLLFINVSKAQISASDLLENAISMTQKGDAQDVARAVDLVSAGLKAEVSPSNGIFKDKLLSQVGNLGSIVSALKSGNGDKTKLITALGTIKTLLAAQGLSNMLKGGNLVGKAAAVASAIAVVKGGLSLLSNGKNTDGVSSLLDKISGKTAKLDKKGLFAKMAQNALKKKLGSALDMVNGLM